MMKSLTKYLLYNVIQGSKRLRTFSQPQEADMYLLY